jgi:RNA polymerase sigma factor (sigma-70 family)
VFSRYRQTARAETRVDGDASVATVVPHPRVELERLYSEHGEQVRAICGSILRNRHEAEDASQQVFVAALRALRGGTVPRDAAAWLATIARHESWARTRRSPVAALPEGLEDRAQEDPATTVVRRAELAETWETIAALPASQREALLLREVRGLGYDELADDLSLSRASVRSLLTRARTTLRMQLERGAAVFTGAQWVNALARLFDSASSPVLPSVTRAAAVGLGALAIADGAVTASTPTHHPAKRPAVHRTAALATARQVAVVSGHDLQEEQSSHRGPGSSGRTEDGRQRGSGSQTSGRDSSDGGSSGSGSTGSGSSSDGGSSGDSGPSSSTSGSDGGQDSTSGSGGSADTVATSDSSSSSSGSDGGSTSGESSGGSSDSGSSGSSDGSSGSGGSSDGGTSDGGS